MNKNNIRKNKTNLTVTWPSTPYFTIQDLLKLNLKFVPITLKVRLANAINDGIAAEIGSIPGGKGRPRKVFAILPVSKETLDKVKAAGINLVEKAEEKFINIISVTSLPSTSEPVIVHISPQKIVSA